MLYYIYAAGYYLAKILPIRICYLIADTVAICYYFFSGRDAIEIRENLEHVLGENSDQRIIKIYTFRIFRNFAKYLADFFKTPVLSEKYILKNIDVRGREKLDAALERGKGVILLSPHLGNWELGAAAIAAMGYPVNAIVLPHKDKRINDFFVKQRALNGIRSIPVGMGIKECFRNLRRNETLAIAGDKDYTNGGITTKFFGKEAVMPKGPAAIALKTDSPIVPVVLIRREDNSFSLIFEDPIIYSTKGDKDTDIKELMSLYLPSFEKYIRMYPGQWYAFKRIWS